ncbi:PH domain-containing protein [soil metagenome]
MSDPAGGPPGPPPPPPRPPAPPQANPFGEPRRLHPSSPVLDLIVSARQLLFPIVVLAFGSARSLVVGPLVLVAIAALVGWKVLAWSRFTYRLDGDVLTIEHGILQRSRREVPVSRIQQVDLRRRLRHRVLGVAVVRIDTAGGGRGAEVTLEAIADEDAAALRVALLGRARAAGAVVATDQDEVVGEEPGPSEVPTPSVGGAPGSPTPPNGSPEVVATLSTADLALAGVTGSRLVAGLALVGAGFGLFSELPSAITDSVGDAAPTGALAVAIVAVLAIPVLLVAAVGSSILTDHGFLLVRVGTDLHLRRGLLDQREATISLHRVQVVRVHENLLRRALGLAAIQLQSAGSGTEAEGAVSRLTIPFVRRHDVARLLDAVLPHATDHPPLVPAPPVARRRSWLRHAAPVLLVAAVLLVATRHPLALLVLVLLAPALAVGELAYRNLGHVATSTLVVARNGSLVRETAFVPVAKAQSTRLVSTPFQRRLHLATLHIDVAGRGGEPKVTDGDASRLAALRRGALHAKAARADEDAVRRQAAAAR